MRTVTIFTLILIPILSFAQPEEFEMEEAFRLPEVEEGYRIMDEIVYDFGEDGVDEIICEIWDQRNHHCKLGIFHNDDWMFYSDQMAEQIWKLIVCDYNSDGEKDVAFGTTLTGVYPFWIYLGPDFEEVIQERHFYFSKRISAGGDRILENGETAPFITTYWPGNQYNWRGGFIGHREKYKYHTIWESSWLTDYPRKVASICDPTSFVLRTSEQNGNEYFSAGEIHYTYNYVNVDQSINEGGDCYYFQLFSSHERPFDQPDSLFITSYPEVEIIEGNGLRSGHRFKFCPYAAIDDFNNDGRLEWAQAHWERIGIERNFVIHLCIYYPDSMVFAREFTDTLNNPYFLDNAAPNFIKGTAAVDVNGDGTKEILFAIQNRPVYIIDSQSMEVMMESNIRVNNDYFSGFEVGNFDDSERLQVLIQNGHDWIVYNLPEGWED
jgi:hypothetical protein